MAQIGRRQEYIRASNIKVIMRTIRNGGKTFAELEEITGLSNAAVFKIVSAMTESGMVLRTQLPSTTAGRRAEIITPNPAYGYFAVILAHSDVLTVTVNDYIGESIYKKEYETGYVVKRDVIDSVINDLKKFREKLNHVVFVFAGKYNSKKDEFVFAEKFREFHGERFAAYLESRLGIPVVMQNDMPAAMQSVLEKTSTPDDFIFLYIDEGVGGGFVFNRKVFSGEHGMAGEFGFFGMNPIDATDFFPDAKSKIFSTELSMKVISDRYIKATGERELNYADAKERFIADCLRGNELAIKILDESVAVMGRILWSLTELLDVSNIIFDGEIVRISGPVKAKLDEMFLKSPTYSKIDVNFITDANAIYNGAVATGIKTFENYV